jgi:methylenetetrahydrofolate dehydrogenase (NADP+) / methenyltetrahydrofolate cyclohydrolase
MFVDEQVIRINMILLDGKKLAQKILGEKEKEIAGLSAKLRLGIVVVGEDPVVRKFIEQKKKAGMEIGVDVRVYPFEESITTNELRKQLAEITHEEKNTGIIVQLPLPEHINTQYILNAITPEKDVDVLSARAIGNFAVGKSSIMPPVVGAIKAFFEEYRIDYKNKYIVIVGAGGLVGKPVALWLLTEGVSFSIVRSRTENPQQFFKNADIIITGIGKPGYITGDNIKEGVVVIDAGISEAEGKLVGDADFDSVSSKASYITPVPGGVGPVTIAVLFQNLFILGK